MRRNKQSKTVVARDGYKFPAKILLGDSELISRQICRNKLGKNRGINKTKQNQKFYRPKAAPKQNGENNGNEIKSSKPPNFVQEQTAESRREAWHIMFLDHTNIKR